MKLFGLRIEKAQYIDQLVSDAQNDAWQEGFDYGFKSGMIRVVMDKLPDGYHDPETGSWITGTGQFLVRTHARDELCDERCVVHNPSQHRMRSMRTHWRSDRGLTERICEHGVGHPDPDAMAFIERVRPEHAHAEFVHGCDGCCGH